MIDESKESPLWPNGAPNTEGKTSKEKIRVVEVFTKQAKMKSHRYYRGFFVITIFQGVGH